LKEKLRETRADVWAVDCYANGGGANLLSFDLRRDGRPGLIAALVHPESLLAKIGIAEGDRILRLGGKRVTSDQPEDFADAIFGGKRRILVEVSKKGRVSRHM